jgi:FixJ family two-component response regulator
MEPLISIVDDDGPVREALQRMLRSYGFATAVFGSAEEFLGSDEPGRTSCLILDMRMPGMSGLALHQHLVAEGCRIPTILITACPTSGERERAIAFGVVSYLAKPFNEHVLLETVRDALEHGSHAAN